VPDQVSPSGDSRSLVVSRAKMPQLSVSAGRPQVADETSQADSPGLQFGLQFSTARGRPGRTNHGCWSSLNRSGRPRSELLMRLGLAATNAAKAPDASGRRCTATVSPSRALATRPAPVRKLVIGGSLLASRTVWPPIPCEPWSLGKSFMTSLLVWKPLIEDAHRQRAAVPPDGSISPGLVRSGRQRL